MKKVDLVKEFVIKLKQEGKQKLPGSKKLAKILGISPTTVEIALKKLEGEGLVKRKERSGTYLNTTSVPLILLPGSLDEFNIRLIIGFTQEYKKPPYIFIMDPEEISKLNFRTENGIAFIVPLTGRSNVSILNEIVIKKLTKSGWQIVFIDRKASEDFPCIQFDNFKAGMKLGEILKKLKYQRPAFFSHSFDSYTITERLRGLKQVFKKIIPLSDMNSVTKIKNFDLIITSDDMTAISIYTHLLREGIKIPQQVGLVSFGGYRINQEYNLLIASLVAPIEELGRIAAKITKGVLELKDYFVEFTEFLPGKTIVKNAK